MHKTTKLLAFYLPLMVLVTIAGWTVLGALPGSTMGGDFIAWLAEIPVVTCYAAAAVVCAAVFKRVFLHEIDSSREDALYSLAINGNADAKWMIVKDRIEWLVLLAYFASLFFPYR